MFELPTYEPEVIEYPMQLTVDVAKKIMYDNFKYEVQKELEGKERYPSYDYGFFGTIEENGDITIAMHASGDDGFFSFSHKVFEKKINNIKYLIPAIRAKRFEEVRNAFHEEEDARIQNRMAEIYKQKFGDLI